MFSPSSPFDAELAARLNDVPLPADLLARLRAIPLADDADFDAALANVAVPAGLSRRLAVATREVPQWPTLLRQAAAAVLVFAVSLAYCLSAVAFIGARFEQHDWEGEPLESLAAGLDRGEPLLEQASSDVELPLIDIDSLASDEREVPAQEVSAAPFPYLLASLSPRVPQWTIDEFDAWPIERAAIRLSDQANFDTRFWRQTGLLPWLDAAGAPSLEVPLMTDSAGYRLVRQEFSSGRLPPPSAIRAEEFLAGIDYGLTGRRPGEPYLTFAAAPSPFSPMPGGGDGGHESRWLVMIGAVMPEEQVGGDRPSANTNREARLSMQVSAAHVRAYRIIGYGPLRSGDDERANWDAADDGFQSRLAAGETAVVLCEIQLADQHDPKAELARVWIEWQNGDDVGASRPPQAVLRGEAFATDFDAAPLAWQQAALVALAAEQLAGSPFAADVSLAEIAARARRIEPLVHDRTGWHAFIDMVLAAQSARGSLLRAF